MGRNYSSTAGSMLLAARVTSSGTTLTLDTTAGLPLPPFHLVLNVGFASEEIVLVTDMVGTSLTVQRAQNGTTASTHAPGTVARHMAVAQDFQEAGDHISASADVHGLAGGAAVVGTTMTQTLTDKTLDGELNTFENLPGGALVDGSVDGVKLGSDIDADTINGRTWFVQPDEPTAVAVGDIWVQT